MVLQPESCKIIEMEIKTNVFALNDKENKIYRESL